MIGFASLSLSACGGGGGGSTSTTPTPPADTTALDARKKKLDATAQQQTQKDKEQAAKERELNNRPPRVVTRTVTRTLAEPTRTVTVDPSHVGFSGSGLSSDETLNLANKIFNIATTYPVMYFQETGASGRMTKTKVFRHRNTAVIEDGSALIADLVFPPAAQGQSVSYKLDFYKAPQVRVNTFEVTYVYNKPLTTQSNYRDTNRFFSLLTLTDLNL